MLTQGLGTILDARHLVLIATGSGKAAAVHALVEGPCPRSCPASVLQLHPHATVLLDDERGEPAHSSPTTTGRRTPTSPTGRGCRAATMRIELLGGFEVSEGDRTVAHGAWRLRKAKTLVKMLALEPAHGCRATSVVDALWPDADVDAARNNLHQVVHAARRALATVGVDGAAALACVTTRASSGRTAAW